MYQSFVSRVKSLSFLIILVSLCSCGVKYKYVPYFTDLPKDAEFNEKINNQTSMKVQPHDILAIMVSSPSPEAAAMFNFGTTTSSQTENGQNLQLTSNGFAVDKDGNIQIPLVGALKISGLSLSEVRALIQDKLTPYLKNPVVNVRLANFKVSVLGDVGRPGVFPIVNNEKLNIIEALSLAGDLNITAQRKNVLLIREVNGERKYIRFDMQRKDLFTSPYYYLQNNDVLYIQPDKVAYANVDNSYRNAGLILSVISIAAVFLSRL